MKLNQDKFKENEAESNHAVIAMEYVDCPIQYACFGIATGYGGAMVPKCGYLKIDDEGAECTYGEPHH